MRRSRSRFAGEKSPILRAMTFRMGYWDCPSCGAKKNLGPNAQCAQCGLPRGPKIAFYTDDSAPTIDDPEMIARARAGADWKCKYCGKDNRAGVLDCHNCGAGPDGSVKREQTFIAAGPPPKKGLSLGMILGIVGGVIAALGLLVWFLFVRTKPVEVVIDSMAWVKSREVLQLVEVEKEDWKENVPAGARVKSTTTKSRSKQVQEGTKKVKVGKKDLGNGMFEDVYKEEPNYVQKQVDEPWVTYTVEEQKVEKVLKNESTDGKEPDDPADDKRSLGPGRKLGELKNVLALKLKGKNGKSYDYEVNVEKEGARLKRFEVGKSFVARVNTMGAVTKLE